MPTVRLEVIAPLVSGVKGCQRCAAFIDDAGVSERVLQNELNSVPEDVWRDYARLSGLVRELAGRYGAQLCITLVDPRSPIGFLKSLRHWVRRYPTFIVNGRRKYVGWDRDALERLLQASGAAAAG